MYIFFTFIINGSLDVGSCYKDIWLKTKSVLYSFAFRKLLHQCAYINIFKCGIKN